MQKNGLKKIIATIKKNLDFLRQAYNVRRMGVFGSFARGSGTGVSDIDILVEFFEPIGFFMV